MNWMPADPTQPINGAGGHHGPDFDRVAGYCAACAVSGKSLDATLEAFEQRLDVFMPPEARDDDPDLRRRLLRIMVRTLWNILPNPEHAFDLPDVPRPGRNAPCHCGSGRKFKACCQPLEDKLPPPVEHINLLPVVLEELPRERWPELAGSRVCRNRLGDAVRQWAEEERWPDVAALLRPWFADDQALVMANQWLLDRLSDALEEIGNAEEQAGLLARAAARGDRPLRSAMLQRQAGSVADQDRFEEAWALFEQARKLDPRSPNLSHLEVVLLIAEGREDEARERARFWAGRLERRRKPDLADLIELLRDVARRGRQALFDAELGFAADDRRLRAALETLPPVICRYRLELVDGNSGLLAPDATLAQALDAWWQVADPESPEPVNQLDDLLDLLEQTPALWDSFEVLDALLDVAEDLAPVDETDLPATRLGERAWTVLERVLAERRAGDVLLEWGFADNRPALSALVKGLLPLLELEPVPELLVERLECLLRLNPDDNQGLRSLLCRVLMESGRFDQARALCERYPEDFAEMRYNHALVLFALGLEDDAAAVLRAAFAQYPKVFDYLDRPRVVTPEFRPGGISVGGDDEAWLYRNEYRDLWQSLGALPWARTLLG
ncbi:MAG: hypothetical protein EA419_11370 [Wenzhouxiangella sp.]|nr:MAG: hypothetical protein EA419_11370 [Wenzhouxiangella sp.]